MISLCRQLIAVLVIVALVFPTASEAKAVSASRATDTYDYDAFGNLVHSTGSTPNNYLYSGEQFDPDLGLYYNRARYLNVATGRFLTLDSMNPSPFDPQTLHRYLYGHSSPVNSSDPTGFYSQDYGYEVEGIVQDAYVGTFGGGPFVSLGGWARVGPPSRSVPYSLKPDILDSRFSRGDGSRGMIWMDVKPLSHRGIGNALASWGLYTAGLGPFGYDPDTQWLQSGKIFPSSQGPVLVFNAVGILFYTTSQRDYEYFEEVLTAAFGFSSAAAGGAVAGQLVNSLVRSLPQVPISPAAGSEVIDIGVKTRTAIQGTEAGTEGEEVLDTFLDAA